jgi:arylsulfatase A-like enzyme
LWTDGTLPPVATGRIAWTPDIAPTLAEAAGLRPLPSWEGLSLFSNARRDRLWIDSVQNTNFASAALVDDGTHLWKLEQQLDSDGRVTAEMLYDVAADPKETIDLLPEASPDVVQRLRALAGGHR